jgi:hypothetical protein
VTTGRSLTLAALILASACSGGDAGSDTPQAGSAAAASGSQPAAEPSRGQSESVSAGTVPMKLEGSVAGHPWKAEGTGQCATSADGSIYQVPASLWHVIFQDASAHLNLVVWRPRSGDDMVNFVLTENLIPHRIATVKGADIMGGGTPTVKPAGSGGTLSVKGRDDHGHMVEMTVECARFDEQVGEGG